MPIPSNPTPLAGVIGEAADVLPIPAQDYTDPTQNGALNYKTGWPAITALPLEAGGKAPRREYFNSLTQLMSSHIFFQQSGSVYPWSDTLDYLTGAHVLGSDGKEYIAQKSHGPDVPDSSAVDPVGDESGTWLAAGSVYAPLATTDTPGIMRPDNVTITIQNGVISATQSQFFESSWIGVPRPWRSTALPENHCWANGDFVAFADWPELKAVYEAGGFAGLLMAWDADGETQAANLGQWRPDAAQPTGLYTPNLTGQFLRCWGPGGDRQAGSWQADAVQGHGHVFYAGVYAGSGQGGGYINFSQRNNSGVVRGPESLDGYGTARIADETRPANIALPCIIYLGQPAQPEELA